MGPPRPTWVCYIWVRFVVEHLGWWLLVLTPNLRSQALLPGVTGWMLEAVGLNPDFCLLGVYLGVDLVKGL